MVPIHNMTRNSYFPAMRKTAFLPCISTRGIKVPAHPDWIHEIKHDGYRLIVHRDGQRVRLLTRNGYNWADRYSLIREAALRMRQTSFALDGEAGCSGLTGFPTSKGCTGASSTRRCSASFGRSFLFAG
jgi:bifunctional non-homologous end joining protein LigD